MSVLHTNLWWPCANQELQRPTLVALVPDAGHDCCSSLSAVLDTCELRHLFWEGGRDGEPLLGCWLLRSRQEDDIPGEWSASSLASVGSAVPSALQAQCSCYSYSFKERHCVKHYKTESVAIFVSITWAIFIFFLNNLVTWSCNCFPTRILTILQNQVTLTPTDALEDTLKMQDPSEGTLRYRSAFFTSLLYKMVVEPVAFGSRRHAFEGIRYHEKQFHQSLIVSVGIMGDLAFGR